MTKNVYTAKSQICHLVDWLRPHPLKVGWRGVIYVHSGAVLKRLPLSKMAVGVHSSYFPEVLLRLSGLTIIPVLSVQSLPVWRKYALLHYNATHKASNLVKTAWIHWHVAYCKHYAGLNVTGKTLPHCIASQLLQSQCWLQLEAQSRLSTWSQLYHRRCHAQHHNLPEICKAWRKEGTKSSYIYHKVIYLYM